ncbi:hypothetical protein SCLCIDRAFT_1223785 [Scleroderma citrinum Foug A]|uniref:Uncharacterized protein n=1 Tax=Scleroderma citrinum Foug A TaxID=1036808 RepID=A0A0C2ZI03_9AGAM|nr:hypothetical protein SCLCIDRAFT_1223785 [Scleroderma citrinum Foug A]
MRKAVCTACYSVIRLSSSNIIVGNQQRKEYQSVSAQGDAQYSSARTNCIRLWAVKVKGSREFTNSDPHEGGRSMPGASDQGRISGCSVHGLCIGGLAGVPKSNIQYRR